MSAIQWTDKTINPIHLVKEDGSHGGHWCRKSSAGCANCYAEKLNSNKGFFSFASKLPYVGEAPANLIFNSSVLERPYRSRTAKKWFICSMTDLFGDWVPYEWQAKVFDLAISVSCTYQVIQILTKHPDNLFSAALKWTTKRGTRKLPPNLWVGTTVENQIQASIRLENISKLREVSHVNWISYEPALSSIDWTPFAGLIDWLVIGGESGVKARTFDLQWAAEALEFCDRNGIAPFVKQAGRRPVYESGPLRMRPKGDEPLEWPEWMRVRRLPV